MSRKTGIVLIMLFLTATGIFSTWKQCNSQPPGLIRLHVLANSNVFYDQDLKHSVKDRIVNETANSFSRATKSSEARAIAASELSRIEKIARDEIRRQGFSYPVKVEMGTYHFPIKSYLTREDGRLSRFTLPPGSYEAVRVTIGEGRGANWWCVLYPPLCFTDASQAIPPAGAPGAATAMEPGKAGIEGKQKQPQIEYRFRVFELWREIVR